MLLAGQDTVGLSQVVYIILVLVWFGAKAGTGKHTVTLGAEGKENIKRIYWKVLLGLSIVVLRK